MEIEKLENEAGNKMITDDEMRDAASFRRGSDLFKVREIDFKLPRNRNPATGPLPPGGNLYAGRKYAAIFQSDGHEQMP